MTWFNRLKARLIPKLTLLDLPKTLGALGLAILCIFMTLPILFFSSASKWPEEASNRAAMMGQVGDFVGGLLNPLIGVVTILALGLGFAFQIQTMVIARQQAADQAADNLAAARLNERQARNSLYAAKLAASTALLQASATEIQYMRHNGVNELMGVSLTDWVANRHVRYVELQETMTRIQAWEATEFPDEEAK